MDGALANSAEAALVVSPCERIASWPGGVSRESLVAGGALANRRIEKEGSERPGSPPPMRPTLSTT
jgi:hypothetical protein